VGITIPPPPGVTSPIATIPGLIGLPRKSYAVTTPPVPYPSTNNPGQGAPGPGTSPNSSSSGSSQPGTSSQKIPATITSTPTPSGNKYPYVSSSGPPPSSSYSPSNPPSYSGQPSTSVYNTTEGLDRRDPLKTSYGGPKIPSNLTLPPLSSYSPNAPVDRPMTSFTKFVPKTESNDLFRVTVTNIEFVDSVKDYYRARPDYRYIIVYLSQQNISDVTQVYTGKFTLLDQNRTSFNYLEGLSNFWLVVLPPGGANFGYLVFEIPRNSKPSQLILHGLSKAPLLLKL
jgi:hypothetical protein